MSILLTGAFGNIGMHTLEELLRRGARVRCFDVRTKTHEALARRYGGRVEVRWGDLRRTEDVQAAVEGQDAVIHLGFVIPRLSDTGMNSEDHPDWARAINVGGTLNLLGAMREQTPAPRLIFASSLHVFGPTQDRQPPRRVTDPVQPTENYALHKIACEEMIKASGLDWAILRLAAAMPARLILDTGLFEVPLANRIEFVHGRDVAVAMANALETPAAWGKTWLIGGGPACQVYYRDLATMVLEAVGVGMLPEAAFSPHPFAVDWLDTNESQRVLRFQSRTLTDYVQDVRSVLGPLRLFIPALRPILRPWLLNQSPYWRAAKRKLQPARRATAPAAP